MDEQDEIWRVLANIASFMDTIKRERDECDFYQRVSGFIMIFKAKLYE